MNLFEEFSPVSAQQWKDQIVKDLKGISFDQLVWKTNNGFDVKPFYTSEDLNSEKQPLFSHAGWDICEQINVKNETDANKQALKALEGGATGLAFYIHKKIDTKTLIKGISLEHIYSQFFISNDSLHVIEDLKEYTGKKNAFDGKIKCFVNIDPLCLLAFYGEWHDSQEKDLSVLKQLSHIPVNGSLYQEAGANTVHELALSLSHLNEYFHYLNESSELKNKTLHFTFAVSGDFYAEIAKLRAFRKLIALLQKNYNVDFPLHIHVQTAQINKSGLDRYTNMLRTTTEAMSAVIGGCDSLAILPFDYGFAEPGEFSNRIARNQQHILKEESYLDKVADISAGSYYIESLTEELAQHAWESFKSIEKNGGFIAGIKNNYIQELIAKDAEVLLSQIKENKAVLVGVNKFQNPKEEPLKSSFLVKSREESKPPYQRIKPIRLAYSFETEKTAPAESSN